MSKAKHPAPYKKAPKKAAVSKMKNHASNDTRNTRHDRNEVERARREKILSGLSDLDREFILKDWPGVMDISPLEFDSILKILLP